LLTTLLLAPSKAAVSCSTQAIRHAVTVAQLNGVLVKHGLPALDDQEWAPLAA
jgi:hypothetical protein